MTDLEYSEYADDIINSLATSPSSAAQGLAKLFSKDDIINMLRDIPEMDDPEDYLDAVIDSMYEQARGRWAELDIDGNEDGDTDVTIKDTDKDGDGTVDTEEVTVDADSSEEADKASEAVQNMLGPDATPEEYKLSRAAAGSTGEFVPENDVEDELVKTALDNSRMSTGKISKNIINTLKDVLY